MVLLSVIRVARYIAVLVAFYGAVILWFGTEGYMVLRIVGGIVVFVVGMVAALVLAVWSGSLAADYAPNDRTSRSLMITGKMGPPQSPHERWRK